MATDTTLAAAIKKAKSDPMEFGFVAKGSEGNLMVDRKVASKDVMAAKKTLGGGTVYRGRCFEENGLLVFEMAKEPPSALAGIIKKTIRDSAGLSLNVEVRANAALAEMEGGDAPSLLDEAAPPPAPDEAAAFAARLKKILPAYLAALQTPNPAGVEELKTTFNTLQTAFKGRDFATANAQLKALVRLLTAKPGSPPGAPASNPSPAEQDAFKSRLKQVMPLYEKAKGTVPALPGLMAQALAAAKGGDFLEGLDFLTQLLQAIKTFTAGQKSATKPAVEKGSFVAFQVARLEWEKARGTVQAELQRLEKEILAACQEEPDYKEIADGVKDLYTMLEILDTRLSDTLDKAYNAKTDGERRNHHRDALDLVAEYQEFIGSDALLGDVDENGFVSVAVKSTLTEALKNISGQLSKALAA